MEKNILFIGDPLVQNTQDYAFPSAAMANDIDYENWIFSNTIQLYYDKSCSKVPFTYFYIGLSSNPMPNIPFFQRQYIKSDSIKRWRMDVIDLIVSNVDEGYYFTTSINEFYNPISYYYKKKDFNHGIMVYGYDKSLKILYLASYDRTLHFNKYTISYKDFELGFLNTRANIGCQSFKKNSMHYEFDIVLVKKLLLDYILSKNTSEDLRMIQNPLKSCVFGYDVYSYINFEDYLFDTRIFHLIYEHKLLMYKRIEKIYSILKSEAISPMICDYHEVMCEAKRMLNLCLKYNITHNKEIAFKLQYKLLELLNKEKEILLRFIAQL